tara:strand:- start:266 stop:613 length:348 start_codon:yes stop_codon:yes gene_type:complete
MICVHCDYEFDGKSTLKQLAGGKINECADCVEELGTETAVKYLGCASADGKMGGISILAFSSNEARETYREAWNNNNGMHKGKVAALSGSNTAMSGMEFRQVGENFGNSNHKGKL